MNTNYSGLNKLQKSASFLIGVLVLLTFLGTNLQALWWQSSDWLVSTVLPSVVIKLTNKERIHDNLSELKRNEILDRAAQMKAEDMAKHQYFSHYSPTGVTPWHWFDEAGYRYAFAGENLAIHFTDSGEVVKAWMNSPSHRANIVNGNYTEIGVGTAKGKYEGYNTVYVVQLFGTPAVWTSETKTVKIENSDQKQVLVEKTTPKDDSKVLASAQSEITMVDSESKPAGLSDLVRQEDSVPNTSTNESNPNDEELLNNKAEEMPTKKTNQLTDPTPIPTSDKASLEELVVNNNTTVSDNNTLVVEALPIATSSGLAIADITTENVHSQSDLNITDLATRPNLVMRIMYTGLASIALFLLVLSILTELRYLHYRRIAYSFALLAAMGGLWYLDSILTAGTVIV